MFCNRCGIEKPREAFNNRADRPSGKQSECRECTAKIGKEWRGKNKLKMKAKNLSDRYGITLEEHQEIVKDGCAICGSVTGKRLCIDHDHTTNKIRGCLCTMCNTAIGLLGDTPEGVLKAYRYLVRSS